MQILHSQHERTLTTALDAQLLQRRKGPGLERLWAEASQPFGILGYPQKVQQIWRIVVEVPPGILKTPVDLGRERRGVVGVSDPTQMPQQVQHRQIGSDVPVRQTMPFHIRHGLACQGLDEFIQEPGLSHARLPHDPDHMPLALDSPVQHGVENGHLALPTHELAQGASGPPAQGCTPRPQRMDRV